MPATTPEPHRPAFFGHPPMEPFGPVRAWPTDVVLDVTVPLHDQIGPDDPEAVSLADWFADRSEEPLDEGTGIPRAGLASALKFYYVHPGVTSFDQLCFKAERNPDLARVFGFDPDDVPHHTTLSRGYWQRLSADVRQHLQLECAKTAVKAAQAGFEVNPEASKLVAYHLPEQLCHYPEVDPVIDEETVEVPADQKRRAADEVLGFLDNLDFDRPEKGIRYRDSDILSVWKNASVETTFAESAAEDTDEHETSRGVDVPIGETVRSAVHSMEVGDDELTDIGRSVEGYDEAVERKRAEKWADELTEINKELIREAQSYGMFDREVTICIDGTAIPTRPKRHDEPGTGGVKNVGNEDSQWCYHYITVSAVDCRRSLKLGSTILFDWGNKITALIELLEEVNDLVNIGWVTWDAAYEAGDLMRYCDHIGANYVGRKGTTNNVVELLEDNPVNDEGTAGLVEDYQLTDGPTMHVFGVQRGEIGLENPEAGKHVQTTITDYEDDDEVVSDPEWVVFTTNSDTISARNTIAHAMLYRVRWSIETAYRVIKEEFKAKTTSRDLSMRVFIWYLAMVLYNAWVLLRILVRKESDSAPIGQSSVRARSFAKMILSDYG